MGAEEGRYILAAARGVTCEVESLADRNLSAVAVLETIVVLVLLAVIGVVVVVAAAAVVAVVVAVVVVVVVVVVADT